MGKRQRLLLNGALFLLSRLTDCSLTKAAAHKATVVAARSSFYISFDASSSERSIFEKPSGAFQKFTQLKPVSFMKGDAFKQVGLR